MLVQFSVENFGSIKDEQVVSFVKSNYYKEMPEWANPCATPSLKGMALLKAAAIYGPNASGKSTILEALQTMCTIVRGSSRLMPDEMLPCNPFRLDSSSATAPTTFKIVFETSGARYDYEFSYTATDIRSERLEKYETARSQLLFDRSATGEGSVSLRLTSKMSGLKKFEPFLAEKPTSLLLSRAAQEGYSLLIEPYRWISSHLRFAIPDEGNAAAFGPIVEGKEGDEVLARLMKLAMHADLGISGIKAKVVTVPEGLKKVFSEEYVERLKSTPMKTPVFLHSGASGDVEFDAKDESVGTLAFLSLAGNVLRVLRDGHTLVVDEIDRSLHPVLVREIVMFFADQKTNPHGAQLLFTSHDPQIMDYLRRDQIWLVTKGFDGSSSVEPLSDFSLRQNEKKSTGYELGRYGAIPYVDEMALVEEAPVESQS